MLYPELKKLKHRITKNTAFGGLRQTDNTPDDRFSDMENLSPDRFPLMGVRAPRAVWTGLSYTDTGKLTEHTGVHTYPDGGITAAASAAGHFCVCSGKHVYVDGRHLDNSFLYDHTVPRSICGMGKNILIMPDALLVKEDEENDYAVQRLSVRYKATDTVQLSYCDIDGTEISVPNGTVKPYSPSEGEQYADGSSGVMYLTQYSAESGWEKIKKLYAKVSAEDIDSTISVGDHIFVPDTCFPDGVCDVISTGCNYIIADGVLDFQSTDYENFIAWKKPPVTDIAIEHNNRIWGCRYGTSDNGKSVNEIYASAPGEPGEWFRFEGTAMDSYHVSLGCSGEFTAAAVQGNDILFFKEDHIIRISGDTPSDFTVQSIPASGVEKGSRESVVNINDRIYYKSREGIMCYDGTYPVCISDDLGYTRYTDAAGDSINGKYYVAMTNEKGKRSIFIYDTRTGFWYKEDDPGDTRFIVRHSGCLFYVSYMRLTTQGNEYSYYLWDSSFIPFADNIMGKFTGGGIYEYVPDSRVSWYTVSGKLGTECLPDRQLLRSLVITLSLGRDAFAEVYIIPEGAEKKRLCIIESNKDGVFSVPVSIPPCQSFRIMLEGKGDCVIHSLTKKCEIAGEVKSYGTG